MSLQMTLMSDLMSLQIGLRNKHHVYTKYKWMLQNFLLKTTIVSVCSREEGERNAEEQGHRNKLDHYLPVPDVTCVCLVV